MSINTVVFMHNYNYILPKERTLYVCYSSVLYFHKQNFNNIIVCQNFVNESFNFKQVNRGIHLQNPTFNLKEEKKVPFRLYLAPKGNYLTTYGTFQHVQINTKRSLSMSNGYNCSHITIQNQLHQTDCTLFFNCVPNNTGRFYLMTLRKDQSKKSIPENKTGELKRAMCEARKSL